MSTEQQPLEQDRQIITNTKPIPQYSVADYTKHAGPIKEMNEWMIDDLRIRLSDTQQRLINKEEALNIRIAELSAKETELKLAQLELSQLKDTSLIQVGLGFVSMILIGIGVNLITSNPPNEWGWGLIGGAALIQVLSFIVSLLTRRR